MCSMNLYRHRESSLIIAKDYIEKNKKNVLKGIIAFTGLSLAIIFVNVISNYKG